MVGGITLVYVGFYWRFCILFPFLFWFPVPLFSFP